MLPMEAPILLADAASAFAASNGIQLEGTMDERIEVCDVEPISKKQKVVAFCIIV
jgi:hypothetical protein